MSTVQLSPTGERNNVWRLRLAAFDGGVPPKYARLLVTSGVAAHSRGMEALRHLLSCPAPLDEGSNPHGDCDLLVGVFGGEKFFLKIDTYAAAEELQYFSEDPADDNLTTRVFVCMLAEEY